MIGGDVNMMWEKHDDVLDWLARINVEELDLLDKLRIVIAFENFIEDVQPIMEKYLEKDEEYKIDWDSFFNNW